MKYKKPLLMLDEGVRLTVSETAPDTTTMTQMPTMVYCLAESKLYICDTQTWRTVATEEIT